MPKTLLLADDSITIQRVVGITFANEDYEITTVDNGDDAVSKAAEIKPDIVLADVIMPKKNGYEVCHAIKNNPELKDIPVLLLAGTFEAFDENRAREVGANGHITKPFESQALIDKVNALVEGGVPAQAPLGVSPPAAPRPVAAMKPQPSPIGTPPGASPASKPIMPRTQPPPPPAGMQTPKQPPAPPKPFIKPLTEPRTTPPPAAAPMQFQAKPSTPGPKPLGTPPQPPKPSAPTAVKPTPMQAKPFESATWEPEPKGMDFLEPLSDDMETTEASLHDDPISVEADLGEPIPLEPEPLDLSFSEEPTDEQAWPASPEPLKFDAFDPQPKKDYPPEHPPAPPRHQEKPYNDDFVPGSLAELSQNERFDAESDDEEFLPVDISPDIEEETSDLDAISTDRPEMAPAHEFIPKAQKPEIKPSPKPEIQPPLKSETRPSLKPEIQSPLKSETRPSLKPEIKPSLETLKLPADAPSISAEEAKKIAAQTIEKIVWEIVPQLAETIIREEIEKLIREKLKD